MCLDCTCSLQGQEHSLYNPGDWSSNAMLMAQAGCAVQAFSPRSMRGRDGRMAGACWIPPRMRKWKPHIQEKTLRQNQRNTWRVQRSSVDTQRGMRLHMTHALHTHIDIHVFKTHTHTQTHAHTHKNAKKQINLFKCVAYITFLKGATRKHASSFSPRKFRGLGAGIFSLMTQQHFQVRCSRVNKRRERRLFLCNVLWFHLQNGPNRGEKMSS